MVAMTAPRKIRRRNRMEPFSYGVKASAVITQTALVQLQAGYLIDAKTGADSTEAGTLVTVGVAYNDGAVGGAGNGDVTLEIQSGEFHFLNLAGDLVTVAEIGKSCYAADNQTVAKTSNTNVRAIAGKVTGVDSAGVWVRVGPGLAV